MNDDCYEYSGGWPLRRNEKYAIEQTRGRGGDRLVKYYISVWSRDYVGGLIGHYFGNHDSPDWNGQGALPQDARFYGDNSLEYNRNIYYKLLPMKKYHAKRAAEVGIATGTKAEGPATSTGKAPRTQAPVTLPRDVTRHIAEFAGQGRRRKTQRAKNLR